MELGVFEQVADAVRGQVPPELGTFRTQARRWGLKAWFDAVECPRAHYEAQVVSAAHVPGAAHLAIEVGFHLEHPDPQRNLDALRPIAAAEAAWRAELGPEAVAGAFLGRSGWCRLSEAWADPDLSDPELCFEVADRLATYLAVVEPLRRDRS